MDRIYRYQRHIYDATRRFLLPGRDRLIAELAPPDGGKVVEIGCGTARNLIAVARTYRKALCFGFDVSPVMLDSASRNVAAWGWTGRIHLTAGDATDFDLQALFGFAEADRLFISYALSMIPEWRSVLACAARQLAPDGELHIVDFGQLERYPRWTKAALFGWLAKFSVRPSADLEAELGRLAAGSNLALSITHLHRGYAIHAVLRRR